MSLAVLEPNTAPGPTGLAIERLSTFEAMPKAVELSKLLAPTDFVPTPLRNKPAAVAACILTGNEVGLPAMASLAQIHVIEGRPTLSAQAMRALVLAYGHELGFEEKTNTRVILFGRRRGSEHLHRVTWTMDDAKRGGLDGRQNWRKFPRAMLTARATGELCRDLFADVLGGIAYTTEEAEDGFDFDGEAAAAAGVEAPAPTTRRRRAASKRAEAPEPPEPALEAPSAPAPAPAPADGEALERARRIGMRARDAGVDHHDVVSIITGGRTRSAKEVTADEGARILEELRAIGAGFRVLVAGPGGTFTIEDARAEDPPEPGFDEVETEKRPDPAPAPAPPPAPEPEPEPAPAAAPQTARVEDWTADDWRAHLKANGVKVADVLREAAKVASEYAHDPERSFAAPGTIDDLVECPRDVRAWLVTFVDELVAERDGD